jgi:hypothetical protein
LLIAFHMRSSTVAIENPLTFLPLRICIGDQVTGAVERWRPNPAFNADAPPAELRPCGGSPVTLARQARTKWNRHFLDGRAEHDLPVVARD